MNPTRMPRRLAVLVFIGSAGLTGCDRADYINAEILRSATDEAPEFAGGACMEVSAASAVGGSSSEYVTRWTVTEDGGLDIEYLIPVMPTPEGQEVIDESDPLMTVGALAMTPERLDSGEDHTVEFQAWHGVHYTITHWGADECELE